MIFAERLSAAVRAADVASRMLDAARMPEPTLARFGGDEFAVLLDGIREPLDAVRVSKRCSRWPPCRCRSTGRSARPPASAWLCPPEAMPATPDVRLSRVRRAARVG